MHSPSCIQSIAKLSVIKLHAWLLNVLLDVAHIDFSFFFSHMRGKRERALEKAY